MITIEQVSGTHLKVFGRDKDGKRYTKYITDFKPYFYDNEKKKVFVGRSSDVSYRKRMYPFTYEADIPYTQRFLIDRCPIPLPNEPIRICYIDIEVANACLDTDGAGEPIISVSAYDNFLKKYVTFVWRKDLEEKKETRDNWTIFYFNEEIKMMEKFFDFIVDTDPDIITGWNVDKYDLKFIINRCRNHLRINVNRISPINRVDIPKVQDPRNIKITIGGRYVLDLLRAYRKLNLSGIESYSLSYIATKELGEEKGKPFLRDLWDDIEKLIEYNKHDVELTVKIDKKRMCIDFFNNLRRLTGCVWGYVYWFSQLNDIMLLRKAKERGTILPTKPEGQHKKEFGGGFVHETIPGLHKGVFVLDLKSLYPSIIQQFNMCYFTVDKEGYKIGNGINFAKEDDIKGLIPDMIQYLMDERDKVKIKMREHEYGSDKYKALYSYQFAMKFVINAVYGATGYPRFRLFNPKIAASITWIGRELADWNKKIIKSLGLKVIYSDTDSVFVQTNINDLDDILKLMVKVEKKLNDSYTRFVQQFNAKENKYLNIRAEKVYENIFFGVKASGKGAKKRYAGKLIWADKKLEKARLQIVGFETKRSDHNEFGKKVQTKLFDMILDYASKSEVDKYLEEQRKLMRTTHIDKVAIPKTLKLNPEQYKVKQAHVRGAEYANNYLDENIYGGDKMKMLYVKGVENKPPTNVICYVKNVPKGVQVDWEKMEQLTINNKVDRVYEAVGWVDKEADMTQWMASSKDFEEKVI